MKTFLAYFLALLIIQTCIMKVIIIANFHVNRDYIASHYCVNKDVKGSVCKGNCNLQKNLNRTESKDFKSPISKLKTFQESEFELLETISFFTFKIFSTQTTCRHMEGILQCMQSELLQPPEFFNISFN